MKAFYRWKAKSGMSFTSLILVLNKAKQKLDPFQGWFHANCTGFSCTFMCIVHMKCSGNSNDEGEIVNPSQAYLTGFTCIFCTLTIENIHTIVKRS
jgi:hypothetical protein